MATAKRAELGAYGGYNSRISGPLTVQPTVLAEDRRRSSLPTDMSALPRTYPPREPTFDSNYAEAASRYYDRFNGAQEWGSYEEKPCIAVSPSMAYSTTGFVGMDGSRGAMSASQPPPAYSESLQQLTYTPTLPYHRSNDQSSWRADVGSLGGLPERPGGPYSTKGEKPRINGVAGVDVDTK